MLLRSNFSSFPQYFRYISNFKSPITHIFVKCGCLNYFFLNFANLIGRGTDILKYFRESLGIRDNESRLYLDYVFVQKYKQYQYSMFGEKPVPYKKLWFTYFSLETPQKEIIGKQCKSRSDTHRLQHLIRV